MTRLRGSGRREYFDMERGAGGGAGERTLEQAFTIPVLHLLLIEARRSGAKRISSGLCE